MTSSSASFGCYLALVGLNFLACSDGDHPSPPPVGGETGDPRPVVVIGTGATASGGAAGRASVAGQGNSPGGSSGTFGGSSSTFGGSSSTFGGSISNAGSPGTSTGGVSASFGGSF